MTELATHLAVGVATVGLANDVPMRLSSSSEELAVVHCIVKLFYDYTPFFQE